MFRDPPEIQRPASRLLVFLTSCLHGGPSGVSSDLGPGGWRTGGGWRSSRRSPKFMLIRAEPASRLPCAAPAASSRGHSAGRSGRAAPGSQTSTLRGSRVKAGAGLASGGFPAGGTARGRVETERYGPPSARVAVRRGGAALGGAGQGHPAPRTASTAQCLPLQPLYDRMASAAAPWAAQVSVGLGGGGNPRGAPRVARRHSHLLAPARSRRDPGTPATGGAVPPARSFARAGAPRSRRLRGWRRTSQPRGPGAAAEILAVPVETFPAK